MIAPPVAGGPGRLGTGPGAPIEPSAPLGVSTEALEETRKAVRNLLEASPSFRAMPRDQQLAIARDTVNVASVMAESGRPDAAAPAARDPYATSLAGRDGSNEPPKGEFRAGAAREGAAVAGALLQAVDFPTFVSKLIEGVFHAIVQSSIEQMEAYGRLVADVAKTLNQFRDENVSVNQGRDALIDAFPDTFELAVDTGEGDQPQPRVRLRDGVDESAALKKVNSLPVEGGPVSSLDDETIEDKLVPAARTQLATSRQQLLATMVMMGINRIVVTDGRIAAKVLYDFQARDTLSRKTSATTFDYGDQYKYSSEGEYESDRQGSDYKRSKEGDEERRGGSYYAKGTYKSQAEPVLKLVSAMNEQTDAALTTKASLAGQVEVNFKSDYFPLEKMADSFQIAQIQDAAKPGARTPAGAAAAPTAAQPAAGTQPAPAATR